MNSDIIKWLCATPATDLNFVNNLKKATEKEIETAINAMKFDERGKHKSRILACERELRKRNKNK